MYFKNNKCGQKKSENLAFQWGGKSYHMHKLASVHGVLNPVAICQQNNQPSHGIG